MARQNVGGDAVNNGGGNRVSNAQLAPIECGNRSPAGSHKGMAEPTNDGLLSCRLAQNDEIITDSLL
jgi:hypothetical protein